MSKIYDRILEDHISALNELIFQLIDLLLCFAPTMKHYYARIKCQENDQPER